MCLRSIDTTATAAFPGVALVLTGADLEGVVAPLAPPESGGLHAPAHGALATDRVRFVGEPLALVVATSRAVAEDAAELLVVDIEPLPRACRRSTPRSIRRRARGCSTSVPGNVIWSGGQSWGDVDAAFATAAHVVRETFVQDRHTSVPHGVPGGPGRVRRRAAARSTYTISHQNPHAMRMHSLRILGLDADLDHRARAATSAGSFGQKSHPGARRHAVVCRTPRVLGRPVKWVEDRVENLLAAGHARDDAARGRGRASTPTACSSACVRGSSWTTARTRCSTSRSTSSLNIVKVLLPGAFRLAALLVRRH